MEHKHESKRPEAPQIERRASEVREDGTLIELVYDPVRHLTSFVVSQDGRWRFEPTLESGTSRRIVPFSPDNNLITTGALLLPSAPEEYGGDHELIRDILAYIHRHVDLSTGFERLATDYVVLSWVYDAFTEVPYLRGRGDYDTDKTRFLLVVGALCYKPFF